MTRNGLGWLKKRRKDVVKKTSLPFEPTTKEEATEARDLRMESRTVGHGREEGQKKKITFFT